MVDTPWKTTASWLISVWPAISCARRTEAAGDAGAPRGVRMSAPRPRRRRARSGHYIVAATAHVERVLRKVQLGECTAVAKVLMGAPAPPSMGTKRGEEGRVSRARRRRPSGKPGARAHTSMDRGTHPLRCPYGGMSTVFFSATSCVCIALTSSSSSIDGSSFGLGSKLAALCRRPAGPTKTRHASAFGSRVPSNALCAQAFVGWSARVKQQERPRQRCKSDHDGAESERERKCV